MAVAKGTIAYNYDYIYTCGNCDGHGYHADCTICTHCYNLDLPRLLIEFKTARGQRYYAILKAILSLCGGDLARDVNALRNQKPAGVGISYADLCHELVRYRWPRNRWKPFLEWLEECRVIKVGAYTYFKERGIGVARMLELLGYTDYDKE